MAACAVVRNLSLNKTLCKHNSRENGSDGSKLQLHRRSLKIKDIEFIDANNTCTSTTVLLALNSIANQVDYQLDYH